MSDEPAKKISGAAKIAALLATLAVALSCIYYSQQIYNWFVPPVIEAPILNDGLHELNEELKIEEQNENNEN